ncbi:MAG: sulfatase-like hydrolase/transferase [Bacteroidales bacterium]|nr:sulfatase-like hydrolase/transferase [Bacteroidales bacterium]
MSPRAEVLQENIENQGIPVEEILLPEIMQSAGYVTALCGKWHLGINRQFKPNQRGFDQQYGFYEAFSLFAQLNDKNIVNYRHDYFANKHIWKQKRKGPCAIRLNDTVINEDEYLTFSIAKQTVNFIERNKSNNFFVVSAFNVPHTPGSAGIL